MARLTRIGRGRRRRLMKAGSKAPKRLASHSRPLKSIVESRERYVRDLHKDEFAKWQDRK